MPWDLTQADRDVLVTEVAYNVCRLRGHEESCCYRDPSQIHVVYIREHTCPTCRADIVRLVDGAPAAYDARAATLHLQSPTGQSAREQLHGVAVALNAITASPAGEPTREITEDEMQMWLHGFQFVTAAPATFNGTVHRLAKALAAVRAEDAGRGWTEEDVADARQIASFVTEITGNLFSLSDDGRVRLARLLQKIAAARPAAPTSESAEYQRGYRDARFRYDPDLQYGEARSTAAPLPEVLTQDIACLKGMVDRGEDSMYARILAVLTAVHALQQEGSK